MVKFGIKTKLALLAGMVAVVFSSCEDALNVGKAGTPVRFGVVVERNETSTRTAYSGEVVGGRERIDWKDDDEILISMYHDDGNGGNVTTDLKQYSIVNIRPDGFKSVAQVSAVGDPLVWGAEGTYHRFVGIYPSTYGGGFSDGGRWNDSTIDFNLPNEQNGSMNYAYMAAITGYYKPSEKATLDFYPMVTTLYFTLVNDTEDDQEVRRIELEQKDYYGAPLVGKYTVAAKAGGQFSPREYGWNGTQKLTISINKQIPKGKSFSIPAFIIPSSRPTGNIYIDIVLPEKRLSNNMANKKVSSFAACKKYNITVNLSGEGTEIEDPVLPEIPPVDIDGLEDGACQFIYAAIKPGLQEKFRELLGNDFINNKIDKMPKPVTAKAFYEMFTEDEIRTMLEYIQKASEISITYDSGITSDISAEDLKRLIPCVRTLTVRIENDVTIYLDEMTLLQTINVEGNGKVIIHADNCDRLTSITWWDKQKQNGSGIYINGEWHQAQ